MKMTNGFQSASVRQQKLKLWARIMAQAMQRYGVSLAVLASAAAISAQRICIEHKVLGIGAQEGFVMLISMLLGFYTSMSLFYLLTSSVQVAT
jgi:glycerol-3-phosphate O-acyltransferase